MSTDKKAIPGTPATRRAFLVAASALAGAAALVPRVAGRAAGSAGSAGSAAPIAIRGHHLFDMLEAIGTGKSSHKTLGPVAQSIRANPRVPIRVVVGVDDICAPCEWWDHAKGLCKKCLTTHPADNENSMASDRNALTVLEMNEGDTMPADALYRLIRARSDKRAFAERVCVACRLVDKCKEAYERRINAAVDALSRPRP